jgi:hypothetical protein
LGDEPNLFHTKNNGITIFADKARVETHGTGGTLEIEYSNPSFLSEFKRDPENKQQRRGLGNGGTTAGAIVEAIRDEIYPNAEGTAYVQVFIRCGNFSQQEITDQVVGLNTNKQVKAFDIENAKHAFDEIREYLQSEKAKLGEQYFPATAFYSGQGSSGYTVENMVQFLTLFARQNEDGEPVPVLSYAGTEGCLKYFVDNKTECLKYLPMLPHIVYLYEFIIANVREACKKPRFGSLLLFQDQIIPTRELPFSHLKTTVRAHKGWVFPVLAAFQPAIADNKRSWALDPQILFLSLASRMVREMNDTFSRAAGSRRSALGREPGLYTTLRSMVEVAVLKQTRR